MSRRHRGDLERRFRCDAALRSQRSNRCTPPAPKQRQRRTSTGSLEIELSASSELGITLPRSRLLFKSGYRCARFFQRFARAFLANRAEDYVASHALAIDKNRRRSSSITCLTHQRTLQLRDYPTALFRTSSRIDTSSSTSLDSNIPSTPRGLKSV